MTNEPDTKIIRREHQKNYDICDNKSIRKGISNVWRDGEFEKKYEYYEKSKGNTRTGKCNIRNLKIFIRKYHSRLDKEEDRVSELEDISIEMIWTEAWRGKKRLKDN